MKTIRTFSFTRPDDTKALINFTATCVLHGYSFRTFHEDALPATRVCIVEVEDISDADASEYAEYEEADEADDEEDYDYDYSSPDDLELGFNPYMGCYDYDC